MKIIGDIIHQKNYPLLIRNKNGFLIYCEYSYGDWWKAEYDSKGYRTFCENSNGHIRDYRE